ncbi:TonB-dependent receptor [Paraurantiacibacter namhicola]|uniref:Pesticin receptor n=1 Tax=Paraurantiacibacter namhicola TaxID=645517 RepID=A0A1C7D4J4_9SPHN|nr:TonB-dependent receptor [Paraurantiacibacter namhicola]ANU06378.1 Pesticin receptor precursor [Paraurantiacibacter namhicola]
MIFPIARIRTSRLTLAAAMLAATALPSAAHAQDQDGDPAEAEETQGGLGEIIVTAQRREESVQDVPIAISAFNDDELARRGVTNALEVAQYVPNLVGLNNTGLGSANAYYLRGLGNTETIPTFDPPVGTYVDDIYLSRQNANNLSLFDVERIEVLRGPQGTLFGRNTTGGAVNVFLRDPEFGFGGYAEAGFGSYDMKMARASVDVPIGNSFAAKVSGYWQVDDGYVLNTTTGERMNESDGWGIRLGLLADLTDSVTWKGSYIHTFTESANVLNFDCDPANPTNCDGRFSTTGYRRTSDFGGLLTGNKNDYGLGNATKMDFLASNFEIGLGDNFALNVITGYVVTKQDYALDFADGRGLPSVTTPRPGVIGYTFGGFTIANEGEFKQFSQELKFTGSVADGLVDLVGGFYYFKEDNFSDFGDIFSLPFGPLPTGLPLVLADRTLENETEAYAGYLQADVNLTDQITLTAGIRYTDETKTFSISDNRASCNDGTVEATCLSNVNLTAGNGRAIPREQQVKIWTPRFAINYAPSSDLLFFASATRGFKSGGWNARGTAAGELLPFDPEKAWSYEAGFKSELFDNRLRVNVTGFWLDVSDLQTPSAFTRLNGSIAFITRNFADYQNKGVEIELNAAPVDGLNLFAAVGYQDDEYKFDSSDPQFDAFNVESVLSQQTRCRAQLAAGLIPGGGTAEATACGVGIVAPNGEISTPVRTPDWTLALGGSYRFEMANGLSLTPAVNASWRDDSETGTSQVTLYDQPVTSSTMTTFAANPFGNGNIITGSFSEARWIVNGTLTLGSDDGWSIAAECRNCLDQEATESTLANYTYLNPPRTWAVRGRFEF